MMTEYRPIFEPNLFIPIYKGRQLIFQFFPVFPEPFYRKYFLIRIDPLFHSGYRLVGEFYDCGYKFGRWYNMVWMEKIIGEHKADQPAVKAYHYE